MILIVSSPLQRCQAFANDLAMNLNVPLKINKQFQEINFGQWDGQLLTELYRSDATDDLFQFMQNPLSISPPQGEDYILFAMRVMDAWQHLMQDLHRNHIEHCLLVTQAV